MSHPSSPRSLVGKFFHSFHPQSAHPDAPEPLVHWQGIVLGRRDDGAYEVGLFSFLDGLLNTTKVISAEEMTAWRFYRSCAAMRRWFEAHSRRVDAFFKRWAAQGVEDATQ